MHINFFIFDWSGTLSDDRNPVYKANLQMEKDFGIDRDLSMDEWLRGITMSVSEGFKKLGVTASPDEIDRVYKKRFNEAIQEGGPIPYKDTKEVLQFLKQKGKRIGVVSAHPQLNLEREAKEYDVFELFDFVQGDARNKQSDLERLRDELRLDPETTIYTGDTTHDIRATKEAGLISGGISTGYHARENLEAAEPDYLFDSLSEIMGYLSSKKPSISEQ